jgi:hypothetical protein
MTTKFRAVRTRVGGQVFDSGREATRYQELQLLEKAGLVRDLECQPVYPLIVAGQRVGIYRADFRYVDCETGEVVTEDAKGYRTPVYRLKKRLVEALYPIRILET